MTPSLASLTGSGRVRAGALWGTVLALGALCGALTSQGQPWLGYAVLVALAYVAAVAVRPTLGVVGVVAVVYLLPFGVAPAPFGGIKPSLLDITLSLVLGIWVLRTLAERRDAIVLTPAGPAVLAFLGIMVTALLLSQDTVTAEVFRFFVKAVNSVLLYFTVVNVLRSGSDLVLVGRMLLLAAGGAAAAAVGLYLAPPGLATDLLLSLGRVGYPSGEKLLRYIADTETLRAIGTAVDPNVLGGMMAVALPLVTAQVADARPVLRRRWTLPLLGLVAAALALTYSRGAWFGAATGVMFLAGVRYRRLWLAGGVAGAGVVASPPGQQLLDRFFSGVTFTDRAAQMRLGEYKDALRLIAQYPVFGVGFGQAPSLDLYVASSSIYLLIASQMGLVGVAAFLLCVGLVLHGAWRAAGRLSHPQLPGLMLGVGAGVLGALSAGLFDHYFFNLQFPHTIALLWLFLGLLAALAQQAQSSASPSGG